jgi:hypothetical protein
MSDARSSSRSTADLGPDRISQDAAATSTLISPTGAIARRRQRGRRPAGPNCWVTARRAGPGSGGAEPGNRSRSRDDVYEQMRNSFGPKCRTRCNARPSESTNTASVFEDSRTTPCRASNSPESGSTPTACQKLPSMSIGPRMPHAGMSYPYATPISAPVGEIGSKVTDLGVWATTTRLARAAGSGVGTKSPQLPDGGERVEAQPASVCPTKTRVPILASLSPRMAPEAHRIMNRGPAAADEAKATRRRKAKPNRREVVVALTAA